MAQYFVDFNNYTDISAVLSEWTPRWYNTASGWDLSVLDGKKCLMQPNLTAGRFLISFNEIDGITDNVEIVFKHRTTSLDTGSPCLMPRLKCSGTLGSENAMQGFVDTNTMTHTVACYIGGVPTSYAHSQQPTYLIDTWYWTRAKYIGDILYYKTWDSSGVEPEGWQITQGLPSIPAPSWHGLGAFSSNRGIRYCECIGFGINGDTAPMMGAPEEDTWNKYTIDNGNRGIFIEQVTAPVGTYPDNGISGGYWYTVDWYVEPPEPIVIDPTFRNMLSRRFSRSHLTKTSGVSTIAESAFFGEIQPSGTPVTIIVDSIRNIIKSISITSDSKRSLLNLISINVDLKRVIRNSITFASDLKRNITNSISSTSDTIRNIRNTISFSSDTKRSLLNNITVLADTLRNVGSYVNVEVLIDLFRKVVKSDSINSDSKRSIINTNTALNDTVRKVTNSNTIQTDTKRSLLKSINILNDTNRKLLNNININSDSKRSLLNNISILSDSIRRISKNISVNSDLQRAIRVNQIILSDTSRIITESNIINFNVDLLRIVRNSITIQNDLIRHIQKSENVNSDTQRKLQKVNQINSDITRRVLNSDQINSDTFKKVISTQIINNDSLRRVIKSTQVNSDSLRKVLLNVNFVGDTKRKIINSVSINTDTYRSILNNISNTFDTVRNTVVDVLINIDTYRKVYKIESLSKINLKGEFKLRVSLLGEFIKNIHLDGDVKSSINLIGQNEKEISLLGEFNKIINLKAGGEMAKINQDVEMYQKEDKLIIFDIIGEDNVTPKVLTGGKAVWVVSNGGCTGDSCKITKTTTSGITIDGSKVQIVLLDTDTKDLVATTYLHELRTIDAAGNDEISAIGHVNILESKTKGITL